MRRQLAAGVVVVAVLWACVSASSLGAESPSARPWTVHDSVQFPYVWGDPYGFWNAVIPGQPVVPSPDGEHFFVVSWRGDLECDCNTFDLQVFSSSQIKRAVLLTGQSPVPIATQRLSSSSNQPAIRAARWIDDGKAIAFLGARDSTVPQVFRFDWERERLERLSDTRYGVETFDVAGGSLVYLAITARKPRTEYIKYPVTAAAPEMFAAVFGLEFADEFGVFASYKGRPPVQIGATLASAPLFGLRYWVSPDGERALAIRDVSGDQAPSGWHDYASRFVGSSQRDRAARDFAEFVHIDLKTGQVSSLFNAPIGTAVDNYSLSPEALWSPSGANAVIVNTTLPLNEAEAERRTSSYIVEWSRDRARTSVLYRMQDDERAANSYIPSKVAWDIPGRRLRFDLTGRAKGSRVQPPKCLLKEKHNDQWRERELACLPDEQGVPLSEGLVVTLEQHANVRPTLKAAFNGKVARWSPFTTGTNVRSAAVVHTVTWQDSAGRTWEGGLLLPAAGATGTPLVIQAGHYDPHYFLPDGSALTAFAAQPLVSRGMTVLILDRSDSAGTGTPAEGPSFVDGVDSAIRYLHAEHGIDRNRVGIVGFSRTGFLTNYLLTHPGRCTMRAAVSADWGDPSYVQYTSWSLSTTLRAVLSQLEGMHGGGTFWENKAAWMANAPGFNAERNSTPTLLTLNGKHTTATAFEFYAAMKLTGQPVDLLLFPEGEHQLKRPRERLASLEATVDWMSFWLQSRESTEEAKAVQQERWRALRRQRVTEPPGSDCGSTSSSVTP